MFILLQKIFEYANVSGRITDERFDFLSQAYEKEQAELKDKIRELKRMLAVADDENERIGKFLKIVRQYTQITELTPDILHSFVEKIYIGETEICNDRKCQDVKIVYNLVGAIDLPQYVT